MKLIVMKQLFYLSLIMLAVFFTSCEKQVGWDFNNTHNRTWIGHEFWSVPLEDWRVNDERVECIGYNKDMRVNQLTQVLTGEGKLDLSIQMGINTRDVKTGKVGIRLGLQDHTDNDIRSLCYYGKGVEIGVYLNGWLKVLGDSVALDEEFDFGQFTLNVFASNGGTRCQVMLEDSKDHSSTLKVKNTQVLQGIVAVFCQLKGEHTSAPGFWFDNLSMAGSMLENRPENSFGPILFNLFTVNKGRMKMTVQMPPLGIDDVSDVVLQVKRKSGFQSMATSKIKADSRIARFNINYWKDKDDREYRIVYKEKGKDGTVLEHSLEGTIPKSPEKDTLLMAGLTCQEWQAFPYRPLTENLQLTNPDLLYFSGDQIYEGNGGYGIVRDDPEKAILNYLGKWYMFGWAFGDLLKNCPTICIPDDHEVYQGNLWGDGGKKIGQAEWDAATDCTSGFVQPLEMIRVVMETNTAHLPAPYDPEPMQNGIPVYYTEFLYGGVSFAIVGDRVFKSGPETVSWWEGRKDHIAFELTDPSKLEKKDLKLLGDRQLEFLEAWAQKWDGISMKCVLSQTVFNNSATHHGGNQSYLLGDMDSGGWPKTGRDKAVELLRKTSAVHICGDQHLASIQEYGLDDQRDGPWVYCTPAISVGYERRFQPDKMGKPVINRPAHNLDNTGDYSDVFGNKFYMYAVANPVDQTAHKNRYEKAQNRASGFGLISFDTRERTITFDAIRFLADLSTENPENHYAGWPHTISQFDNLGTNGNYWLPTFTIKGAPHPIAHVYRVGSDELIYSVRIKGKEFSPPVYGPGNYKINFTVPGRGIAAYYRSVEASTTKGAETFEVNLDDSVGFTVEEIK